MSTFLEEYGISASSSSRRPSTSAAQPNESVNPELFNQLGELTPSRVQIIVVLTLLGRTSE